MMNVRWTAHAADLNVSRKPRGYLLINKSSSSCPSPRRLPSDRQTSDSGFSASPIYRQEKQVMEPGRGFEGRANFTIVRLT